MPSPFPGMDPYLEARWRDVHARLVIYTSDALQGRLPGDLRARVEERVLLETGPGPGSAVATPLVIDTEPEAACETFIEIIDRESGNRMVTVLEFLSPSNKSPGPNRDQYRRKQRTLCSSDTNLVEIDLTRFGTHTLAFPLAHIKPQGRTPYMASIRRVTRPGQAEVYPMPLWERLPIVNIPLRPTDDDVPLDLQALIDLCYRNGGYEGTLNYAADPDPPLAGADKSWAEEWLSGQGLRPVRKTSKRQGTRRPPRRRQQAD